MIKLLKTIIIITMFFTNNSFAEIIQTSDMAIIEKQLSQLDKDSIVAFDINHVLLVAQDEILQGKGKKYKKELRKKMKDTLGKEEAERLFSIVYQQRAVGLVDQQAPRVLSELQARGIKIVGLTNCFTGKYGVLEAREESRAAELEKFGYHFEKSWEGVRKKAFDDLQTPYGKASPPVFAHGIIFTSKAPKGEALSRFLDYVKFKPKKIVFVDNRLKNIKSVEAYAKSRNIPFIGIEYTALAEKEKESVNKQKADLQFKILQKDSRWISDEEAEEILLQE